MATTPTPTATPVDPVLAEAKKRLAAMSLDQKIASLLMLHVPGTEASVLKAFINTYNPGGLIFMGDNVGQSAGDVAALAGAITDPKLPLLLGVDQEGGVVDRLPGDDFASAKTLKNLAVADTTTAFTARSALVASCGLNLNFGIVADVTADPNSFIYSRVLGTTPAAAADRVGAAVAAAKGSVLSTLKHFPGHGSTTGDSHTSLPASDKTYAQWLASDAVPFQRGIGAGAEFVMLGHLTYGAIAPEPATVSARWHEILRDELGFDGIIISDDMLMLQRSGVAAYKNPSENAIRALAAGTTMLLYVLGSTVEQTGVDPAVLVRDIAAAVASGRISEAQIDDAALRLLIERVTLAA